MAFNSENIEAKLCAYIEGDLDEAGRAEIERHMAANPQHAKLIADLKRTRELVRDLPRVTAPGELGDSLRGHVERSLLLGGAPAGGSGDVVLKINRWPQVGAIAAVLVLASGLGWVVYKVVMPTFRPPQFTQVAAKAPPAPGQPDEAVPGVAATESARAPGEPIRDPMAAPPVPPKTDAVASADVAARAAAGGVPATLPAPAGPTTSPAEGATVVAGAEAEAPADAALVTYAKAVHDRLATSGIAVSAPATPGQAAPLLMVVSAADPASANDEVARYLSVNNITYQPVPTIPAPPLAKQWAQGMASAQQQVVLPARPPLGGSLLGGAAGGGGAGAARGGANAPVPPDQFANRSNAVAPPGGSRDSASNAGTPSSDLAINNEPTTAPRNAGDDPSPAAAAAAAPTTRPAGALAEAPGDQSVPLPAATVADLDRVGTLTVARLGNLYVARRMTKRQAEELKDSLALQKAAAIQVVEGAYSVRGQTIESADIPTTGPAPAVALRYFENIKAAAPSGAGGATTEPIAGAPGAAAPATQPIDEKANDTRSFGIVAAPLSIDAAPLFGAATQPASAAGDQPLDVVIVVQNAPAAPAAVAAPPAASATPATQPAPPDASAPLLKAAVPTTAPAESTTAPQ